MGQSSGLRYLTGMLLFGLITIPSLASAQATFSTQLLLNPGGEEQANLQPGANPSGIVTNWDTMGTNFNVDTYDSNDVAPSESTRINGGKVFFTGGPDNEMSQAVQKVNVSALAAAIDTGTINAVMDAQLTGFTTQGDNGTITVNFLDANQTDLGSPLTLGPQAGNNSIWVAAHATGLTPKGTRTIIVTMTAKRTSGSYNDAYFDNLSLVLPPRRGDLTGDGKVTIGDVTVALQIAVGSIAAPTMAQVQAGDLDGSGEVSIPDVIKILQFAIGAITQL